MADDNSKWIRDCSMKEQFMELNHQQGIMVTCYCLTLNSVKPLQEYHMQRAFLHLLRKVPTLSLCLRSKNDKLSFHRMEHEKVDFKILKADRFQEELESMARHHYDVFEGPLWCARLMPCLWDDQCEMPLVKEKFPNQYKLLFGIHHSITDDQSTMSICNFFLNLLNDVIAGKPINDHELLASFGSDENTQKEVRLVDEELLANPDEFRSLKNLSNPSTDILYLKAYPPTAPSNIAASRSLSLVRSLTEEQTSSFLKKSKAEGVTVHSALTTVANAAVVKMLLDKGFQRDRYDIPARHILDTRRYWSGVEDLENVFGCHMGVMSFTTTCSRDIQNEFWNHARQFDETFQIALKNKQMLKEFALITPESMNIDSIMNLLTMIDPKFYFNITNMGNLATLLSGEGEHVQYTNIGRTTSDRGRICSHVLQTFRGRLLYALDYGTEMLTTATAVIYADTFMMVLKDILNSKMNIL